MRVLALLPVLVLLVQAPPLSAQTRGRGLGFQVGTLGLGPEIQGPINDLFSVRGGANYLVLSPERTIDGVHYEADIELKSAGAVVDFYPGGGNFRLTGGFRLSGNGADLDAQPTAPVNIGGTLFAPAQIGSLNGTVEFNTFAPYLGIGWQSALMNGRLRVGFDLGTLYQGRPDVHLSATGPLAGDPAFESALSREAASLEDDLAPLRFFPVVSLTFTVRF